MYRALRQTSWTTAGVVREYLNESCCCCRSSWLTSRRSAFTITSTRRSYLQQHDPGRRWLSLKVKPSAQVANEQQTTTITSIDERSPSQVEQAAPKSFIELDNQRFTALTSDFIDALSARQLKTIENTGVWRDVAPINVPAALDHYAKLSKFRLTSLVVLTTLGGFYMATAAPAAIDYPLLAATLAGTALTSGSAAAWNHYLEVPFDSQMRRTQERPLVRGAISPLHAASFAAISGAAGLTILATAVNPLTATLGAANLFLYSLIYTPLKRVHIVNTWVGAVVGAIPPVMGFTAVTGVIDLPSLLLGWLLYSWQFPHFNALSWNMRHEYARAGYRMMSVTDPKLCLNTALRHSLALAACTAAMCASDMTHWSFGVDSAPFTAYLVYLAYKFRSDPSSKSSRKLFLYSLVYLPAIMFLMVLSKNRKPKAIAAALVNEPSKAVVTIGGDVL